MLISEHNGLVCVTSELMNSYGIKHMFSTIKDNKRPGLSISFSAREGYSEKDVFESYCKVAEIYNVPTENITKSTQIHDDKILVVEDKHIGMGVTKESDIKNADGLITDKKNIPLCIFTADCVPVIISDKNKKVVSAVHSGWRGTAKKITVNAINLMVNEYKIQKSDIICAIGPSIGKCCFEVSYEVIENMSHIENIRHCYTKKANGKYMLDLKEVNKQILLSNGIAEKNIDVIDLCTKCEKELFFSYRRQGEKAGRNASFIMRD